jgi:DNA-binding MarR family transcriptional regulator
MNGYQYAIFRDKNNIDQYQDFIIGLIDSHKKLNVKTILELVKEHNISSMHTTHRALTKCIDQGYLKAEKDINDYRRKIITLTSKGKNYINDLKLIFKE